MMMATVVWIRRIVLKIAILIRFTKIARVTWMGKQSVKVSNI